MTLLTSWMKAYTISNPTDNNKCACLLLIVVITNNEAYQLFFSFSLFRLY